MTGPHARRSFALETTSSLRSLSIRERPTWPPPLAPPAPCSGRHHTVWELCPLVTRPSISACHFVLGAEVTDMSAARLLSGIPDCCIQPPAEGSLWLIGRVVQTQSPTPFSPTCFSTRAFPLRVEVAPFQRFGPQMVTPPPAHLSPPYFASQLLSLLSPSRQGDVCLSLQPAPTTVPPCLEGPHGRPSPRCGP